MWKWFAALAVVMFLFAGGVATYRYYEAESKASDQRPFLEALESGDPERLTAMMDESLRRKVDPTILDIWLQVVAARLGPVEDFVVIDRSTQKSGDVDIVVSEAEIRFARGTGTSQLIFRDGELTDFSVRSSLLANWLEDLPDTSTYEAAGQEFIMNFFGNKPKEAFLAMDPETLQRTLPFPKLVEAMKALSAKGGQLYGAKPIQAKFSPANDKQKVPVLTIDYELNCANAKSVAHLMYAFPGLKGRLIAFTFE